MRLTIGNQNYSSWSLRPWLALAEAGASFQETVIPLDQPDTKASILRHSPSGKVPALQDDSVTVFETLAILEYIAERFPAARLWPEDRAARAHARSICSEMHAGFSHLRNELPMNLWRPIAPRPLSPGAEADVQRVQALWADARARWGQGGPYLFGAFTNADAMFAPVATRLRTYAVPVNADADAYVATIHGNAHFMRWREAALRETWLVAHDEVDWPEVKRV